MRPAPLLLGLLVGWGLLGGAVLLGWLPRWGWAACAGGIALLALVDGWRLRRLPSPLAQRQVPESLALGVRRAIELRLEAARPLTVQVFDGVPGAWPVEDLPQRLRLRPGHASTLTYHVQPQQRGQFQFEGVQVRVRPWRLWWQQRLLPPPLAVRVYPNFVPLTRFALFSAEQASRLVGAHLKRRRGEGTDFHQMREYRVGDSLRQVDWKATARARKLVSREYQDEKNQQLVLMVDTGRRMLASEGGLSHFDHALNAALVVAYLSLRQGDGAGLLAIGGGEQRWVAPQRGMGTIEHLLRASYDLQPRPVATDYLAAATTLSVRQQRRALVMLVTNVRDEDIEDLLAAVRLLQRRHLVCVASLREQVLDDALATEVATVEDAAQAGAAALYLQQRAQAHDALRAERVMVLDVTAEALPAALVERYLSVKREGLL